MEPDDVRQAHLATIWHSRKADGELFPKVCFDSVASIVEAVDQHKARPAL